MIDGNKNLVVVGTYPNSKISQDVLKKCLNSLKNDFDILLSAHYPVDESIQNLTNFYIYDSNNEIIENTNNPVVWYANNLFYLQVKHKKNFAYATYTLMKNSFNFSLDKYNDFFYINGDTILDPDDIGKLISLKKETLTQNKQSFFFKEFDGMLDTKVFYCQIDFFKKLLQVNSKDEFVNYTGQFKTPYIPFILESYFSEIIDKNFKDNVNIIYKKLDEYLNKSQIDVISSFNGVAENKRDYNIYLLKEDKSNKIFFVYVNNNQNYIPKTIQIQVDNDSFTLENGYYSYYKEVFHNDKEITLKVENVEKKYQISDILENKECYIRFTMNNFEKFPNYDECTYSEIFELNQYEKFVQVETNDTVLDLGCSKGYFYFKNKNKNIDYIGIDGSLDCLNDFLTNLNSDTGAKIIHALIEDSRSIKSFNSMFHNNKAQMCFVMSFQDILKIINRKIDFLKFDIEGYEKSLLKTNYSLFKKGVHKFSGELHFLGSHFPREEVISVLYDMKNDTDLVFKLFSLDGVDISEYFWTNPNYYNEIIISGFVKQ